ncbi:MAG: GxxExxY protein [Verrucomicrobiota bacterium]
MDDVSNNQDIYPELTHKVIAAAIEVHRALGPGLLESIYERCLIHELQLRGHQVEQQTQVNIAYKDLVFEESLRCDLIVDDKVLTELKSVEAVTPVHKAQTLSYLRLLRFPVGLLINFNVARLTEGVSRLYNKHSSATASA